MSRAVRVKRRVMIVCVAVSAVALAVNTALVISGHPGRYAAAVFVLDSVAVVSGLLYLRSARGRP